MSDPATVRERPTAPDAVPALEVDDLRLSFVVRGIEREAIRGVSFRVDEGEAYGLVGESGCGKSTIAFAAMRYMARNARISGGAIRLAGTDLLSMPESDLRTLHQTTISMVYQNPGTALNPSIRVGEQAAEVFRILGASKDEAVERAREMLAKVQISDPERVMRRYPHQLSGGMQQRVVIAMALAKDPTLLILDEPTTGLDATVEAEVLDLVSNLRREYRTSVLFISHNLGVVARVCDRVGVLYAGRMVEEAPTQELFRNPRHPYTVGLLRCIPKWGTRKADGVLDTIPGFPPAVGATIPACVFVDRCALAEEICRTEEPSMFDVGGEHRARCHFHDRAQTLPRAEPDAGPRRTVSRSGDGGAPLVQLRSVSKTFRQEGQEIHALDDVSIVIGPGETLGLVGESGSGKTTLARALLGIITPDGGSAVELDGQPLAARISQRPPDQIRALQVVFQSPDSSLNRRHTVRRIVGRALTKLLGLHGEERETRIHTLTHSVRLDQPALDARPAQLSGGLKQRVAIARAFAGDPRLVLCDEPTSALDVSVQAAILNLLVRLQDKENVAYLFISHDLGVVRYISDRIAVLYLGRVMEVGSADVVFGGPHHPYTEALLSAAPILEGEANQRIRLEGEIPSAASPPTGCVFHTRCPRFLGDVCVRLEPPLAEVEPGHFMRCHIPIDELRAQGAVATGSNGGTTAPPSAASAAAPEDHDAGTSPDPAAGGGSP
jgi:peptide/nickel transport system ATP-binding protein